MNQLYQFFGVMVLTGYACSSYLGWEFANPIVVATAPPAGAMIARSSTGYFGRSSTYYGSSSGTRSGWGGGGFGGK